MPTIAGVGVPSGLTALCLQGQFIRISAQTRSWESAERKARLMEFQSDPLRPAAPESDCRISIEKPVKDFLVDEQARKLAATSICQSKTLLEKQLLPWAQSESLKFLDQLTTSKLREFRASWGNGGLTTQRKHHRLNGFFCILHGKRVHRRLRAAS